MKMEEFRKHFGVPAKRGGRVEYITHGPVRQGTITSTNGLRLMVRLDGEKYPSAFHPLVDLNYLPENSGAANGAS